MQQTSEAPTGCFSARALEQASEIALVRLRAVFNKSQDQIGPIRHQAGQLFRYEIENSFCVTLRIISRS